MKRRCRWDGEGCSWTIMSWRAGNKTLQILEAAEKGQYGILAAIA